MLASLYTPILFYLLSASPIIFLIDGRSDK